MSDSESSEAERHVLNSFMNDVEDLEQVVNVESKESQECVNMRVKFLEFPTDGAENIFEHIMERFGTYPHNRTRYNVTIDNATTIGNYKLFLFDVSIESVE